MRDYHQARAAQGKTSSPRKPAECGTLAGHSRRKRRHETPFEPCKQARRDYDRGWEAK